MEVHASRDGKESAIKLTMPDYADMLRKIHVSPLRASVHADKLTPQEVKQFLSALGQNGLVGNKPDARPSIRVLNAPLSEPGSRAQVPRV